MIPKHFSAMWESVAPGLGNHVWQSTLFAITAGLLILILRKNHARARYWLWLAASVKFLIPFSLLVGVGSYLTWARGSRATKGDLYIAMEEVSRPFTQPTMSVISRGTSSPDSASLIHLLPAVLAAVWLCGFAVVLLLWYRRWRRISVAIQEAVPLREGREAEALRRLERTGGIRNRIEVLLSRTSLEPGIFGIARPVLLWPEGISEHLEDGHLDAILAHELWHVRRRDNLAAAIHLVVEAIFWFHPLVWWLGARLIEERECACDEAVLESGGERRVYAESILKVCEFCVGSPLACVSGVTGADLKKRIVHIMSEHIARKLDFTRKLLLSAAGLLAIALPIGLGLINAAPIGAQSLAGNPAMAAPGYVSVSIKPNKSDKNMVRLLFTPDGFSATGITLQTLIREAYGVQDNQISGAPDWVNTQRYDIEAKRGKSAANELRALAPDQVKLVVQSMLQSLLADRFKLTLHLANKDLQQYSLVVAENGPKLQQSKPEDTYPNGIKGPDGHGHPGLMQMDIGRGRLTGQGLSMSTLATMLSRQLGSTVLDKTGLTGSYDFTLLWTPDANQVAVANGMQGTDNPPPSDASGPSIFTAVQEQLGLELKSQTGPVGILVIDHVESPSEN
jgi:bla regulator protein blaR1